MALLVKELLKKYSYAMTELTDPRTKDFFLISSPIPVIFIISIYLLFVKEVGPRFMKHREPMNIDKILYVYNAAQVLICAYPAVRLLPYVLNDSWLCAEVNYEDHSLARLAYIYFCTKILDLLDTVFFVLRKKDNQATFLHIYHHTLMVLYVWYGLKYACGGQMTYVGFINSCVHVVMYSYYLLSSYNKEYRKSIWWKKYITQLQMVQFGILSILFTTPLLTPGCNYPKFVLLIAQPQVFAMFLLFGDFYYKTYIKKTPAKEVSSSKSS